jgi:hypothetical protein
MARLVLLFIFQLALFSCNQAQQQTKEKEFVNVGSIKPDPLLDDPAFTVCDEKWIFEYYNFQKGFQFEGEKIALINYFNTNYKAQANDNGYFTVRFVVNCKGETGRFRTEAMDFSYQPIEMKEATTHQLLKLCKELKGWGIGIYQEKERDYYQYLTFKIENGHLTDILP